MKILNRSFTLAVALATVLGLSACGTSKTERALSGGGIGAGLGAAGAGITGGNPWTGAAIGGAAGAATGYLTNEEDINVEDWYQD